MVPTAVPRQPGTRTRMTLMDERKRTDCSRWEWWKAHNSRCFVNFSFPIILGKVSPVNETQNKCKRRNEWNATLTKNVVNGWNKWNEAISVLPDHSLHAACWLLVLVSRRTRKCIHLVFILPFATIPNRFRIEFEWQRSTSNHLHKEFFSAKSYSFWLTFNQNQTSHPFISILTFVWRDYIRNVI